jgi:hypothetical protein
LLHVRSAIDASSGLAYSEALNDETAAIVWRSGRARAFFAQPGSPSSES